MLTKRQFKMWDGGEGRSSEIQRRQQKGLQFLLEQNLDSLKEIFNAKASGRGSENGVIASNAAENALSFTQ